jgi:hypothetical protein
VMGLLISVGGLMYVNVIRSLNELKQRNVAFYLNYMVGKGEEYSQRTYSKTLVSNLTN